MRMRAAGDDESGVYPRFEEREMPIIHSSVLPGEIAKALALQEPLAPRRLPTIVHPNQRSPKVSSLRGQKASARPSQLPAHLLGRLIEALARR